MRFRVIWTLEGVTPSLVAPFGTSEEANAFVWKKLLEDDFEQINSIYVIDDSTPILLTLGQ